ncbi:hypothetical protein [Acidisphaera sp. L21]|uniref:hypothetical protein n=1 Tax=Acidisphaera sp. L21 TaxID=1641851 RepID=UPI00131B54FC|nr:hypothetical protein [Acidisphaera sp. L21]
MLSRELIDSGVIREASVERDARKPGRPSILLDLDTAVGCFAGVSVEAEACMLVLTSVCGSILAEMSLETSADPPELAGLIGDALARLLSTDPALPRVLWLSVALPGFVNHAQDICPRSARGRIWRQECCRANAAQIGDNHVRSLLDKRRHDIVIGMVVVIWKTMKQYDGPAIGCSSLQVANL